MKKFKTTSDDIMIIIRQVKKHLICLPEGMDHYFDGKLIDSFNYSTDRPHRLLDVVTDDGQLYRREKYKFFFESYDEHSPFEEACKIMESLQ